MKRYLTFALLTILAFSAAVMAQTEESADEAAIRQNVKYLEDGWNKKSGALFAKPFAEDADYVVINGAYIKGRTVIESQHERIFSTIFKDTLLKLEVKQVRFLRADVAVAHVSGHRDSSSKELIQDAMITVVMTKDKQGWKIAAFQNTAVMSR